MPIHTSLTTSDAQSNAKYKLRGMFLVKTLSEYEQGKHRVIYQLKYCCIILVR